MQRAIHSRFFSRIKKATTFCVIAFNKICQICKFPFGFNLNISTRFYDATYKASSFLFNIGYEIKTMKVSDLPNANIQNKLTHNNYLTNYLLTKGERQFLPPSKERWVSLPKIL